MRFYRKLVVALLALALIGTACSSDSSPGITSDPNTVIVEPDFESSFFVAQVDLTDEGFDPPVLYLPAGRQIRLVLRNHGTTEHHYRVKGLVTANLRWRLEPEVDSYDLDSMTVEELADIGIDLTATSDEAEIEHLLHHLAPSFVPYKEASVSGIKPLGTEVHGYVDNGVNDILYFYPLNTGRFEVQDEFNPEITGTVVVFLPDDAQVSG